jgi:hypothetical protein
MDLSAANTEALLRFHRFHERFNRSIKVQAIGLGLLADEVDAGTSPDDIKDRLYSRSGWLWGGMPDWTAPSDEIGFAQRDVGQAGVVRAFSAFDLFLDEILGELTSWSDFSGKITLELDENVSSRNDAHDTDRLDRLLMRLGETRVRVSDIWPVYVYFRRARNCIAHREGIASPSLVEAYSAPSLEPTLERWVERTGELTPPALVAVRLGEQIDFSHRQAIAASSTLRLIAINLGQLVIERLGEQGFVYLVARRTFFDNPPLPTTLEMTTMVKAFNAAMSNRYRVRNYDPQEALGVLRELGLTKQCSTRFAQLRLT